MGQASLCLVEVEDEVQLAHVAEVPVQHLHEVMNHLQSDQLVVPAVNAADKIQARVPLVHHLLVGQESGCDCPRPHKAMARTICYVGPRACCRMVDTVVLSDNCAALRLRLCCLT